MWWATTCKEWKTIGNKNIPADRRAIFLLRQATLFILVFAKGTSAFDDYLRFNICIPVRQGVLLNRNFFHALHGMAFTAVEMGMYRLISHSRIECIFHKYMVHNNFMNNAVFLKGFERPVKSGSVVLPTQAHPDFIFRKGLVRSQHHIKDSLAAAGAPEIESVQNINSLHECKDIPFATLMQVLQPEKAMSVILRLSASFMHTITGSKKGIHHISAGRTGIRVEKDF